MISQELRKSINENAHNNGWWDKFELHKKLLLIISEVCEAMEADRKDLKACCDTLCQTDDTLFLTSFEDCIKHTFEDEMADIIIRVSDLCYEMNIDIELFIKLKYKYTLMKGKDPLKKY